MYPRFSETFIVNEILAHEAAGLHVEIVSLRSPVDGRFHEDHARVRAHVTYLSPGEPKATRLWELVHGTAARFPEVWSLLAREPDVKLADLCQALQLAPLLVDRGIEVMHAHFGSVATTVARLASELTGIPYIFTAHAKDIYHEEVDDDDLTRKLAAAAATITVSDYNLAHLRTGHGSAASRAVRIYNGLPLDKFPYRPPAGRNRHIVAVGRLVEKKGFDVLVEACAILRDGGEAFTCEIVGAGPEEDALRTRIRRHNLEDQVHLTGPKAQGAVIELVQRGAVFAAPCIVGQDGNRDGLPTVLLEAMALGTPCVATDVTGIPELVEDGVTGLLVAQHDSAGLATALRRLLDDPALGVRLAAAARARIEADFDAARNTARLRALYATVAAPIRLPNLPIREVA
jgi:glycosyltransferase involved in cell wall biosynthesis